MKTTTTIRKIVKARDIPPTWDVDLPGDPDATVTVTISPNERSGRRPLTDFIGAGQGVHETRDEADAYIRKLRDEWQS